MVHIVFRIARAALPALCCSALVVGAPKTFEVNCDGNSKVAEAVEKAEAGDTIRLIGVCREKISLRTDRITLIGLGGAVIQGGTAAQAPELDGLVTVDGARGVIIRNLTIQGSRAEGVFGTRGAAFTLEGVMLQDNAGAGLGASSSFIDTTNVTSRRNWVGFDLSTGTHVVARGRIIASDNQNDGIFVGGASTFEIRGANVEANNNTGGVVALGNSHIAFWFFNGPQTNGGSITVSGNRVRGIALINGSMEIYSQEASVTARNNPVGITVAGPGGLSSPLPDQGVRILLEGNGVGLNLAAGAAAVMVGGFTARNNTTAGIVAENATLTLISLPPLPSVVSSNALDLDARFGARLTVGGVAFATKNCEPSVLARGVPGCP